VSGHAVKEVLDIEKIGIVLIVDGTEELQVGSLMLLQRPDGATSVHRFIGVIYPDWPSVERRGICMTDLRKEQVPPGSMISPPA
jgi:hypothetical protein